jgi:hypothetical protein
VHDDVIRGGSFCFGRQDAREGQIRLEVPEGDPKMEAFLFHVIKGGDRLVMFRMQPDGSRDLYLPSNRPVGEVWPCYAEISPYLDVWFGRNVGRQFRPSKRAKRLVEPGSLEYPRMLAHALTRDPILKLWAYATPLVIWVSFHQIARALGRDRTAALRHEMAVKGLRFSRTPNGHYQAALGTVAHVLGPDVADRLLMYPRQIADFLGVSPGTAPDIVRRMDIALEGRRDMTVVEWGKLRQVRRTGPRRFEIG